MDALHTQNTNDSNVVVLDQMATSNDGDNVGYGEIIQIAFHQLERYEHNVRVVKSSKQSDKQLLASIRKHGILQNLIVFLDENDCYKVVGGDRRLAALAILVNEGHYTEGDTFPCLVTDKDNAIALSLHENSGRESMHPADQFMAYKALVDQGLSVEEVAIEFGESVTHIRKRLKLSSVAPRLIQFYRNGKLTLDAVMAFTVSDSHKDQLAAYTLLAPHSLSGYQIKNALLGQAVEASDRLVKFVGLSNYQKAGGSVSTDMFDQDKTYINQPDLIVDLARKAMNKQCGKLLVAGWKWADFVIDHHHIINDMASLEPQLVGAEEIQAEIAALVDEQEGLGDLEWSEDVEARDNEIDMLLDKLESQLDRCRVFSDEQKAISGVTVYCDYHGKLRMEYGRVRAEDIDIAFPNQKKHNGTSIDGTHSTSQDTTIESQALKGNLHNYRIQALQSQIALKPALANDLLIFSLAVNLLATANRVSLVNIHSEEETFSATKDIESTKAHGILHDNQQALILSWLNEKTQAKQFEQFQTLTPKQKQKIMAHCVALSFTGAFAGKNELQNVLETQLDFDFSTLWQPTADNYFSKLQKKHLLALGADVIDAAWAERYQSAKKSELVELLSKDDQLTDWMPACV